MKNRKQIYLSYNIIYKSGKIFHPVLGWIPELLVNGNSKIGKGVYHFSTLPTNQMFDVVINQTEYEIKGTCPCSCEGCYATKGNYNYPSVRNALGIRTWLVYNDLDFLYRAIRAQIEIYEIKYIRIHASGDFCSDEYINMWVDICLNYPGTLFWSYTKNRNAEASFDSVENGNIVKSLIPGKGFNFGHCDYIIMLYDYLTSIGKTVYICRCGIDKNQHCINCKGCLTHEYVLFIEHSTEYNAESDPHFEIIKQIIENQANQEM